ncbi:MAG TPA: hypothetical protein VK550_27465 [Polyangiaceae bacterium]|nr:hypothetical protein [Polyangiaceae bacterium]
MNWAARMGRALQLVTGIGLALGEANARASDDGQAIEQRIRMQSGNLCPTAAAVAAETWGLTPAHRRAVLDELREVQIEDLGAAYRIVVTTAKGTKERIYQGPERDCEKRARFVAVFVVLTLMPPEGHLPDAAVTETPSPATPPPSPETSKPNLVPNLAAERLFRLELAAMSEQGIQLDGANGIRYFGGSLRALMGRGVFTPALGVSYAALGHFDTGGVQGDLARAAAHAGLRARVRASDWELGAEVDAVVVTSRATATSLLHPTSDNGIELGVEAALLVALPTKIFVQPFLATSVRWIPVPHGLTAQPRGEVGVLPHLWIGASAGIALRL